MVDEFKSEVVGDVTYIWKRKGLTKKEREKKKGENPNVDHVWIPWLLVAKSALLARLGIDSLGLYAATRMKEGTRVGKYKGRVVGRYAKKQEALHAPEARDLVLSGKTDKIAALRCEDGSGWCLLDGDAETAPCIPRVNDPTGTGFGENCLLSDYGILRVKAKSGIPAFDPNASLDGNIGSELRWSYGEDFWGLVKQAPGFQAPASKQRQEERPTPPSKPPSAYHPSTNVSRPNTSEVEFVSPTPSTKTLISVFPDAAFSILTRRTCSDLFLNPDLPLELPTSSSLVVDACRVFMTNPLLNVILNSVVGKQRENTHLILEETELRVEENGDGTLTLSTLSKLELGTQLVSLKRCPKQYVILPLGWRWIGTGHFTFLVLERNELPDSDPETLVRSKWTAYHVDSNGVGRFYDCLKEAIPTLLSAPIEGLLLPLTTTYLNISDSLYNVLPKPYDNEKTLSGYCKLMGLLLLLDFFCVQDRFFGNDHLKRLFQVILGEGNLFSVDGSTFHLPVLRSFYEKQVKIYLIAFTFKMMKALFLEKTEEEREKEFGMDLSYEKEFDLEKRMRSEKTFFLTLKRTDKEKLERQTKKQKQKNAPKDHTVSWPSTPPPTPIPTPSPSKQQQTASPSSNTPSSPPISPSVPVAPIRPLPTCSEEDVSLLSSLPMKVLQSANTAYCKRRSLIDSKFPSLSKASHRGEDEKKRCREGVVGKTKEELASSLCKMSLHNLPYKVRQAGCSLLKETSDAVSKDVRCNSKKHLLPTLLSSPLPHEVDATVDAALSAGTTFLTHTYSSSERDKLPSLAAASSSSSSTSSSPSLGPRQERLYRNLVGGTHTIHVCLVGWKEGSPLFSAEGWSICFEEGIEREGRSRGVGSLHILSMGGKKGAGISFLGTLPGRGGTGKESGKRVSGFANPYATLALHTLLAKKGFVRVKVGGGSKPRTEKRGKDIAVDPEAPCSRLYETQYLPKREPDRSRMEKYWRGIELVYRTVGFTLTSQGGGDGYTPRMMDASHFPTKAEVVKRLKEGV